jgi:hypothetical protein
VKKSILVLTILYSSITFAIEHKIDTPAGSIIFATDDREISQRKFFGADLWFTGSVNHEKRNVMSVVFSTSEVKLDPEVKDEQFSKHKIEMLKFAKERGYTDVNFKPYEFQKIRNDLAYHNFVWSYKKDKLDFLEESYYVECNNILFIAKATTTLDSKSDQDKFKKIIENVRCVK